MFFLEIEHMNKHQLLTIYCYFRLQDAVFAKNQNTLIATPLHQLGLLVFKSLL